MSKRSDIAESVLIGLEILSRIPRGKSRVTAKDLCKQLADAGIERDLRTIQRLLDSFYKQFQTLGLERDDRSKPYGYYWLEGSCALSVPHMTPMESLLLRLSEEHLRNLLPAPLLRSMSGFFSQARANLSSVEQPGNTRLEREWMRKVRVVTLEQPLFPPKIKPEILTTISEALYHNRWLKLDYRNADSKRKTYEVMPLGLVQQGPCLYLVCRFKDYENERNLAMQRILSASYLMHTFARPKDFDLEKYDIEGHFRFGQGERVRLRFRIDKDEGRHLRELKLSDDQTIKEYDDAYEITATVIDTMILQRWLNGFGDKVWNVRRHSL